MLTIGTHMSIAKGIAKTAENVVEMKANTMQIFSRNPRPQEPSWLLPKLPFFSDVPDTSRNYQLSASSNVAQTYNPINLNR